MSDQDLFSAAPRGDVLLAVSRDGAPRLNVTQLRVFDELLAVAGSRPISPAEIGRRLADHIEAGTRDAVALWPEKTFWLGKALFSSLAQCEGKVVADAAGRSGRQSTMHPTTAAGIVAHRAIQIAHTHADRAHTPDELVRLGLAGAMSEENFAEFWNSAAAYIQSDVVTKAVSALVGFIDSFPPLSSVWAPRFEESVGAKIGNLSLSARIDLILGRPKADGRQTMFLCDVKTSDLRDHHPDEAMFYALIATLRYGVAPFRSTVYSTATGEWTDPDVTSERLFEIADKVVARVNSAVEVLGGHREPTLTVSHSCAWCPAKATCSAYAAAQTAEQPTAAAEPAVPAVSPVDVAERTVNEPEVAVPHPADTAGGAPSSNGDHADTKPAAAAAPSEADAVAVADDPWAIDD